jgi:hypothetical protein
MFHDGVTPNYIIAPSVSLINDLKKAVANINVAVLQYTESKVLLTKNTQPGTSRDWKGFCESYGEKVETVDNNEEATIKVGICAEDDVFPGNHLIYQFILDVHLTSQIC